MSSLKQSESNAKGKAKCNWAQLLEGDNQLNDYVSVCPNSLIYSCPSFMDLISVHLEASPGWILAKDDNGILGALLFV